MSLFYSIVSKLFAVQTNEQIIDEPQKDTHMNIYDKFTKISNNISQLSLQLRDETRDLDMMILNLQEQISKYNDLEKKYKELECKYEQEQLINKIIKEKYLKEPNMTNVYNAFDNMTINQFKNIIPKMDLEKFPDITTKDKYFNACMYMFVRKFNNDNKYGTDEFIEYVVNNTSLTVDTREALKTNIINVRKELGDFYEFIQLY